MKLGIFKKRVIDPYNKQRCESPRGHFTFIADYL